jgi:hypothetical protein
MMGSVAAELQADIDFFQSQIDALRGAVQYEPLCFQFGAYAFDRAAGPFVGAAGDVGLR